MRGVRALRAAPLGSLRMPPAGQRLQYAITLVRLAEARAAVRAAQTEVPRIGPGAWRAVTFYAVLLAEFAVVSLAGLPEKRQAGLTRPGSG